MDDISQHLPLSQRASGDESGVSGNWRPLIGDSLIRLADLLDTLTPEQWEAPSLCTGWTVREVAGHLVWVVGSSRRKVLTAIIRSCVGSRILPMTAVDRLSRATAHHSTVELVRMLRELASRRLAGLGRRGVGDLTEVVVHGYDIAAALAHELAFSAVATGAVAVARAARAPAETKALLRNHIFTATDAGWSVGRGTPLAAPTDVLIPRLFSRTLPEISAAPSGGPTN